MKLVLSLAPAGPLRALLTRAGVPHDRILLTELTSVGRDSLTFARERHRIDFRIYPPDSDMVADLLLRDIENAEFAIRGQIVADISVPQGARRNSEGSISIRIEAPTTAE